MPPERFSGPPPLLVGVVPGQHPEVLQTAVTLAQQLTAPLLFAYVDEASYLVEWDPARSTHRLSLHPDKNDDDIRSVTEDLKSVIVSAVRPGTPTEWTLRTLAGDPARALGRLAAEVNAPMIIVGTPERGFRAPHYGAPQRLRRRLAHPPSKPSGPGGAVQDARPRRTAGMTPDGVEMPAFPPSRK